MTMTTPKPPRTRAPVVDAVALLEEEHAATRELLAMLLRTTSTGRHRDRVIAVLCEDLWIHMQIEEELFYPALAGSAPGLGEPPTVRRALREALYELEQCPVDAPELLVIASRVLAIHEEDSGDEARHVFPHARRVLGGEALVALGQRLRARRQELRESGAVRREPSRPEIGLHRPDV